MEQRSPPYFDVSVSTHQEVHTDQGWVPSAHLQATSKLSLAGRLAVVRASCMPTRYVARLFARGAAGHE